MKTRTAPWDYDRNTPMPSDDLFATCSFCGSNKAVKDNGGYQCYKCGADTTMLAQYNADIKTGVDVDAFLYILENADAIEGQTVIDACEEVQDDWLFLNELVSQAYMEAAPRYNDDDTRGQLIGW